MLKGRTVGAGCAAELYLSPALLSEGLGLSESVLEAASRSDFRPARRTCSVDPPLPEASAE